KKRTDRYFHVASRRLVPVVMTLFAQGDEIPCRVFPVLPALERPHVVSVQLAAALSTAATGVIVSFKARLAGVAHVHRPSVLHALGGDAAFPVVTLLTQVGFAQFFARLQQRTLAERDAFLFQPLPNGH